VITSDKKIEDTIRFAILSARNNDRRVHGIFLLKIFIEELYGKKIVISMYVFW
jgi:hypothetical protein